MNYLSAENISKIYGEKLLFKNVNFGINQGERVGLIGINGSGKSTFLKILAGIEIGDTGIISLRKGVTLGYLGQNPTFIEDANVFDNVFTANHPIINLIREYENHLNADKNQPEYEEKLHQLVEQMTLQHAWEYENRIKEIISRLGLGDMMQKVVSTLSGGQRKRVAMARILIEEPQLLILDEPTNHLDLETIEWLEDLIHNRFETLIIVTHDRYFLDKVTNQILEIDKGETYKYKGDYGYFLEKKADREQMRDAEIEKARNLMRKELDWIRRQPKARSTKAKYRVDAFEGLQEKAKLQKADPTLALQVKTSRQGGKVLDVKRIWKGYEEQTFIADFTHSFRKGEKVGIIGKNGTGKSTLLNILTGKFQADKGDIELGDTTIFGYYTQEGDELNENKRVIEEVKDIAEVVELADGSKITASQFLTMFMFPPAVQHVFISTMSGGEKRRLQLLKVLIKNPNFLILDEPTNDLDISALNVLEDFLEAFKGTLVLVSHDRYFMDRLVEHIFVFEGEGKIKDFPGNYTEYRERLKEEAEEAKEKQRQISNVQANAPAKTEAPTQKRKVSFKEQRRYEQLSGEIEVLEKEKTTLTHELATITTDFVRLQEINARLEAISEELDEKEMEWLELSELM
jgi:ABC transport system ATP-binding/permease protein